MRINKKIQNRTAKIGVIGLGNVGLPLDIEIFEIKDDGDWICILTKNGLIF